MRRIFFIIAMVMAGLCFDPVSCFALSETEEGEGVNVQHIIFEHMLDSYTWHITKVGDKDIAVYLPVILYSNTSGWHVFSSRRLHENGGSYEGFYPAPEDSAHAYKLMEKMPDGSFVRPVDLSLTKMGLAIIINSIILLLLFLPAAKWYRKHRGDTNAVPSKYVSFVEMLVGMVEDGIIKPCIGENYKKFSPYLLTAFFFIFTSNLMSLLPIFPGGVGITANMSITMFLALCTFIAVNVFGSREYWKEILWPDVPTWLKAPVPLMPLIELIGIFTKPIALMIRLFANMLGGHMAMLVLTVLIFIGFSAGAALGGSMTFISVLFNIFMYALELLVAYIQAYVFTLLSAVFIGSAQIHHHKKEMKTTENSELKEQ
ncbi:MAG: F0F1 ATP synthase subunit A [Bacteroidales bacterium]|nr:F0F1 ATP synthase subunit A [Bacteroidales bacterium]